MVHPGSIVILDFGSQYTHLIGNRIRRLGAYSEILPPETPAEDLKDAAAIILSGGPQSVYDAGSPQADKKILELGKPVLGLCYGLHWMTQTLGGEVKPGHVKEYGRTKITIVDGDTLLQDCGDSCTVWMSHGDEAVKLPEGFKLIATSDTCKNTAFADETRKFFALQFHPEVMHSEHGIDMLKRFVDVSKAAPWSVESFAKKIGDDITKEVGEKNVFMLVSGGVDSTVAFTLLNQVLGADRVVGLLVDTGLMRKDEVTLIKQAFDVLGIKNLHVEDASEEFLSNLKGVTEPEKKRQIIGDTFLAVQKRVSESMQLENGKWMLGQGTIYPDTIETGGTKHADKIKTHHNRVDAIQKMIDQGLVIEPLKELYKDEVRILGEELGLPHDLVWRHPFPGPGLGVRILCADKPDTIETPKLDISHPSAILPIRSVGVQGDNRTYRHALVLFSKEKEGDIDAMIPLATSIPNQSRDINRVLVCLSHADPFEFSFTPLSITRERADLLRDADNLVDRIMRSENLYQSIWQFPVVLLPAGSTPGGQTIVLRPVESTDAMTAGMGTIPASVLAAMTKGLLAIPGIDTVLLDMTTKPPGTIEWE